MFTTILIWATCILAVLSVGGFAYAYPMCGSAPEAGAMLLMLFTLGAPVWLVLSIVWAFRGICELYQLIWG